MLKNVLRITKDALSLIIIIILCINIINIRVELVSLQNSAERMNTLNVQSFTSIERTLDNQYDFNVKMANLVIAISKESSLNSQSLDLLDVSLGKKIDNRIKQEASKKIELENKLKMVNIFIKGRQISNNGLPEEQWLGSGITLKYNGRFYILTAQHLLMDNNSQLTLNENDIEICKLKVIKQDVENDLLLLVPEDDTLIPKHYVELADHEPILSQELYIVGNPAGIEDVVSEGRVAFYDKQHMIFRDGCYFGNSGGGIYDKNGRLVSVVSAVTAIPNTHNYPPYVLDIGIRLRTIKEFLKNAVMASDEMSNFTRR